MLTTIRRRLQAAQGDEGFSLVEMVVAFAVLAVFASALGITLVNGLGVSKAARQRVAAANLAAREIEIVRNQFASSDTQALAVANAGNVTNANPLAGAGPSLVDGTAYTIQRDVQWLPIGNGASACDGGSLVNYPSLRVSVAVTWPNMRTTKPVVSQTLLTPPKGTLDNASLAFIAVKVTKADGTPSGGVVLDVSGPGGTFTHATDSSGCAVFQVGTAGTYSAVADMAGWVDQTGVQHAVKSPISVSQGSLARVAMTYDRAATLDVTLGTDAGYALPQSVAAVKYTQPNVPSSSSLRTVALSGSTATMTGLWPTLDGYSPWAGGCNDSDPAGAPTYGSRIAPVVVPPGGRGSAVARLAPVQVVMQDAAGTGVAGASVTATSLNCGAVPDAVLTLGTTDATGALRTSLPYGTWQLNADGGGLALTMAPVQPNASGVTTFTMRAS